MELTTGEFVTFDDIFKTPNTNVMYNFNTKKYDKYTTIKEGTNRINGEYREFRIYNDDESTKHLSQRCTYLNGNLHGVMYFFNKESNLYKEISYVNGIEEGPSISYWSKLGKKRFEEHLVNGRVREKIYYNKNGDIVLNEKYDEYGCLIDSDL